MYVDAMGRRRGGERVSRQSTYVIVGGGLAASMAAETLRSHEFDGRVVLVSEEDRLPYSKPPLSKEVLRGEQSPDEPELRTAEWYKEREIEVCLGVRATKLDAAAHIVDL